jgi:hypothetical protein
MFPGVRKAAAGCSGRDGATGRVAGNIALDAVECGMRRIIIASIAAVLPTCVAAAELPKKTSAPPRDAKVLPCPAYGAGFVRIEGTTTCIKVGGSVSVETTRSR